ncbi:MAG: DNA polymerase III subunit delta [bacterium ADurb.Bin212]|nr:MAG: DNA polymerase III subunit delta [bacterium ADurb.Bin212]
MIQFIYGENMYLIKKDLAKIEQEFLKSDPSAINMEKLEGEDITLAKFTQAISAMPFLAEKRLVVVRNLQLENKDAETKQKMAELLQRFSLKSSNDKKITNQKSAVNDSVDIVFIEMGVPDKRSKIFKFLLKEAKCTERKNLEGKVLTNWIKDEFESRGVNVSQTQLQALAYECSGDMLKTLNEIEKLSLYAKSQGRKTIEKDDISKLVKVEFSPDIFKFTEAIAKKDSKQALRLWFEFVQNNESAHRILSMITYQFRTMIMIKEAINQGLSANQISKETRLHPFVVQKTMPLVQKYTIKKLVSMYDQLRRTEAVIKGGVMPSELATDILITSLSK